MTRVHLDSLQAWVEARHLRPSRETLMDLINELRSVRVVEKAAQKLLVQLDRHPIDGSEVARASERLRVALYATATSESKAQQDSSSANSPDTAPKAGSS